MYVIKPGMVSCKLTGLSKVSKCAGLLKLRRKEKEARLTGLKDEVSYLDRLTASKQDGPLNLRANQKTVRPD